MSKRNALEYAVLKANSSASTTKKQGYLFRRKGKVHPVWDRRFFVCAEGMMLEKKVIIYFKKHFFKKQKLNYIGIKYFKLFSFNHL